MHRAVQTPTWQSPEQPAVVGCHVNKVRWSPEGPSHLNSSLRITYIVHTSRPLPPAYNALRIQHANAFHTLQEQYLIVKGISNCCQQLSRSLPAPNKWPVSLPSYIFSAKSKFSASTISWFNSGFLEFQKNTQILKWNTEGPLGLVWQLALQTIFQSFWAYFVTYFKTG